MRAFLPLLLALASVAAATLSWEDHNNAPPVAYVVREWSGTNWVTLGVTASNWFPVTLKAGENMFGVVAVKGLASDVATTVTNVPWPVVNVIIVEGASTLTNEWQPVTSFEERAETPGRFYRLRIERQ